MKNLLTIILFLFFAGCNTPGKVIMQTWKIDDVIFLDSLNTFSQQQKLMIKNKLTTKGEFKFLRDSIYQISNGNETVNGRWWLANGNKSLFTTTSQKTVESKIHELKKRSFKFESQGEVNQSALFICSPVVTDRK